jgi:hypothetical protein
MDIVGLFLPDDFLMVVDESHMTVPQIQGMYHGDRSRKQVLVDYGFRLPSALDNRPLSFQEWEEHIHQVIYMSATPGPYELERSQGHIVDQVIRPTGLVDPRSGSAADASKVRLTTWLARFASAWNAANVHAGHHPDQAHGRGPFGLLDGTWASRCTTCIRRLRRLIA